MTRVNIIVEGQTEETFVRDVLYAHFVQRNIFLNAIILRTSKYGRGGVSTYGKIRNDVLTRCKQDSSSIVTTMLDFYGLPSGFPGLQSIPSGNIYTKANHLEKQFKLDINEQNFIPNLIIHEFEGLLYSNPEIFSGYFSSEVTVLLQADRIAFESPEHINNNYETAPSKRIERHSRTYQKALHGPLIAKAIGIDVIRKECRHFNEWITALEALSGQHDLGDHIRRG